MLVQAKESVPDFKRWQIGAVTVTRITEIETFALPADEWFPIDAELVKKHIWLRPDFADEDGRLLITVQAFVIESAGMKIMVDPCVGNHKIRQGERWNNSNSSFLEHMALAGFPYNTIDVVLCTHLHFYHVGWNTR